VALLRIVLLHAMHVVTTSKQAIMHVIHFVGTESGMIVAMLIISRKLALTCASKSNDKIASRT